MLALDQLWGRVDPSDGIAFRQPGPVQRDEPNRRARPKAQRCVYQFRDRFKVLIRRKGRLLYLGVYGTRAAAQKARNKFLATERRK
jgi:hypothetical protein